MSTKILPSFFVSSIMPRGHRPFLLFAIFFFYQLTFVIQLINAQSAAEIPQKFFGAFQYSNSDNWDDYLLAKGYNNAEERKKVALPKLTRVLFPVAQGGYRMMVGLGLEGSRWAKGSKKNADWTFQLGKEFRAKYWDGREHLILFTYNPTTDQLTERHVTIGANSPPEEFVYQVNSEGNLDMHVQFQNVHLVHHYTRTD